MIFLQETSKWETNVPNHIYLLNDEKSKMVGYVKSGTKELIIFSEAMSFNTKHRSFKEVKNTFGYKPPKSVSPEWTIKGSKGAEYIVKLENGDYTCTCPAFLYSRKGTCKHILSVQK